MKPSLRIREQIIVTMKASQHSWQQIIVKKEISHGNTENTEASCFEIAISYHPMLCGYLQETKKGAQKI